MKNIIKEKKKLSIGIKLLIVAGCVAVLFASVFLLRDTYLVTKYRLFMKSTINNILNTSERYDDVDGRIVESEDFAKIEKEVPFKIEKPQWLPEGYELDCAETTRFENDAYIVGYKFTKENDYYINFFITTNDMLDKRSFAIEFEEVNINDMDIIILELDGPSCKAHYMNNQGFHAYISGTIDKETLIKIIENMG